MIPKGSVVRILVHDSTEDLDDREPLVEERSYQDGKSDVRVIRREVLHDLAPLLDGYHYGEEPLSRHWGANTGGLLPSAVSELRVAALAFAAMGVHDVHMTPKQPPDPDLFVDCEETGPLGVEITLAHDHAERSFQSGIQEFCQTLNEGARQSDDRIPADVSIAFRALPTGRRRERAVHGLLEHVRGNWHVPGRHYISGDLSPFFASYLAGPRTKNQPFSGGADSLNRGHPDRYATVMDRIADKRDLADYRVRERANWLIVGMSSDPLFAPDTTEIVRDGR